MAVCGWQGCAKQATHTVVTEFPDAPREDWMVCREHDRALKSQTVFGRAKAEPPREEEPTIDVCCGVCEGPIEERSDLPVEQRNGCPACGSLQRSVKVGVHDTVTARESLRVQKRTEGKSGTRVDMRAGDDYTKALEGWGRRELTTDRESDFYREIIELHDGTRIESTAKLRDHHG